MKKLLVILATMLLAACGGGGGGSSTPASTPATPIPVQKSSYLNKVTAANAIGPQAMPAEVSAGNAVAFADFFQDGTYSMVTHTLEYNSSDPSTANKFGHIHFYKKVNGSWVDHTSDILSDNVGCLHPRKAIVADFNGDGKPDVLFACHGFDAAPFKGEQMHLLLSQSNGAYQNTTLPFVGFFHSASAADFGGKGFADIVVVDPIVAGTPYFLKNNGDGTFTQDSTSLACAACKNTAIYTSELIDVNGTGKYDLILAGTAPDNNAQNTNPFVPTVFTNSGNNTFSDSNEIQLPFNPQYETTLDVLAVNGTLYTTNVHLTYNAQVYGFSDVEKITGNANTQIWSNNSNFTNGSSWLNWIIPFQGKIDSLDADYGVSVAQ